MAAESSWSLRGIDPRAREIARAQARKEGITIGEWLNRRLLDDRGDDDDDPDGLPGALERLSRKIEAAEHRSTLAITGIDQSVLGVISRLQNSEETTVDFQKKYDATLANIRDTQDALQKRIKKLEESDGGGKDLAKLKSLEAALDQMADRVTATETLAQDRLAELETGLGEVSTKVDKAADVADAQIQKARADIEKFVEKQLKKTSDAGALQDAVAKINNRLGDAENITDKAMKSLGASLADLETRLNGVENSVGADPAAIDARFDALSKELGEMIAETRVDIAGQLEAAASGDSIDGAVEARIAEIAEKVAQSESRQSKQLERIATEVGKLAGAMEGRIKESEKRMEARAETLALKAVEGAGDIDHAIEARLREIENNGVAAVDRMGDEIARVAERLQDKIADAERRSADALEGVSTRVDDLGGRIAAGGGAPDDLVERIQASEERTSRMVEEAMSNVYKRLDAGQDETAAALSPVQRALSNLTSRLETLERRPAAAEDRGGDDERGFEFDADMDFSDPAYDERGDDEDSAAAFEEFEADTSGEPVAADDGETDGEDLEMFVSEDDPAEAEGGYDDDATAAFDHPDPDADGFADDAGPDFEISSSFELRPESGDDFDEDAPETAFDEDADLFADSEDDTAPPPGFLTDPGSARRARDAEASSPGFGPVSGQTAKPRRGRRLLAAASVLAFVSVAAAAYMILSDGAQDGADIDAGADPLNGVVGDAVSRRDVENRAPASAVLGRRDAAVELDEVADTPETPVGLDEETATFTPPTGEGDAAFIAEEDSGAAAAATVAAPDEGVDAGLEIDAVPTIPVEIADVDAPAPAAVVAPSSDIESAAEAGDPIAQYQLGAVKLQAGLVDEGVRYIRQAAENGLPSAQYRLAKLYENGRGVGSKDLAEARRWTERAANAGHRKAMHNLGIYYAEGRGASQDFEQAARWFEEAALLGATDSQYNLAVLYEQGLGVPLSLPDAYAWYAIAGRSGDGDAALRADSVGGRLDTEALDRADEAVERFTPGTPDPAANGVFADTPWDAPSLDDEAAIARAQTLLAKLGYDIGPADGAVGPRTRDAVEAYQAAAGLAVTGVIDATLLEQLDTDAAR